MEKIEQLITKLKECILLIESEVNIAKEKKFVYARAKNIRKSAQEIKVIAQDLRTIASESFKAVETIEKVN